MKRLDNSLREVGARHNSEVLYGKSF